MLATLVRSPQSPSRVAAAIRAEIAEGRLQEGDRLPTEMVLAARFGVSRSVVREAIAGLRSNGFVRSRQGLGAFVVSPRESATLRIDADLTSDLTVFRNVFELRAILEIKAAALAAVRADENHRARISEALERMRAVVAEGYQRAIDGAEPIDPTLKGALGRLRNEVLHRLAESERKVIQGVKRRDFAKTAQLDRILGSLRPLGKP